MEDEYFHSESGDGEGDLVSNDFSDKIGMQFFSIDPSCIIKISTSLKFHLFHILVSHIYLCR